MSTAIREPGAALDIPPTASPAPGRDTVGKNEFGTITVSDSVVGKLAARAAVEIPDAGGAAPRVLGRSLAGASRLGIRDTSLTTLPKSSARVDGYVALVDLELSVRWPASIPAVTERVRSHVRQRLTELTGLQVPEVTIRVTDLVTSFATPRVR